MAPNSVETWILRSAGFAGIAVFGAFFAFTFSIPQWAERFGADFIANEVIEEVEGAIDAAKPPENGVLARAAADAYARNEEKIEDLKAALKTRARAGMEYALAQVRDSNCECRRAYEEWRGFTLSRIAQLARENGRIAGIIHGAYLRVVHDLQREIRIFTATNVVCFLLVLLVSFAKPAASRHLLFPGALLVLATLFCAWLYVFSQNWLLTIIHGSYVGYAYAGYLGIVFLFVCDIALNRGRVTTIIVNSLGSVVGSAGSLTPC